MRKCVTNIKKINKIKKKKMKKVKHTEVVFVANYLKVIWQSNSNKLEYEIWLSKGKILSFLYTICWLYFIFLNCPK